MEGYLVFTLIGIFLLALNVVIIEDLIIQYRTRFYLFEVWAMAYTLLLGLQVGLMIWLHEVLIP